MFTAILALVIWGEGCNKIPSGPEPDPRAASQFGGYTTDNEVPAFGDPATTNVGDGEVEYNDPILGGRGVDSLINHDGVGWYHLRAVWGRLRGDSTVVTKTDWTGSLTISRGAEILRRVIRFEDGDYIVPRTDRKTIEWVTFTTGHNDGIAVDLFVPRIRPVLDSSYVHDEHGDSSLVVDTLHPESVTVEFTTGPYSRTFTLEDLAKLDTVVHLDDGNSVAFHALRMFRNTCPRGFLGGHWGFNEEGKGAFRGVWVSKHGHINGHFQGHFEENDKGERTFFGKWIDLNGRFEGFIRGIFLPYPAMNTDPVAGREGGRFEGGIFTGEGHRVGEIRGHYRSSEKLEEGFLQGRWKFDCLRNGDDGDHDGKNGQDFDRNNDGF